MVWCNGTSAQCASPPLRRPTRAGGWGGWGRRARQVRPQEVEGLPRDSSSIATAVCGLCVLVCLCGVPGVACACRAEPPWDRCLVCHGTPLRARERARPVWVGVCAYCGAREVCDDVSVCMTGERQWQAQRQLGRGRGAGLDPTRCYATPVFRVYPAQGFTVCATVLTPAGPSRTLPAARAGDAVAAGPFVGMSLSVRQAVRARLVIDEASLCPCVRPRVPRSLH